MYRYNVSRVIKGQEEEERDKERKLVAVRRIVVKRWSGSTSLFYVGPG